MHIAKLKILDEVNVKFEGIDDIKVRRKMVDALKFFQHSARYSPSFRLGRWDGYISFCTLGGQTFLQCVPKILPILKAEGYRVEVEDLRPHIDLKFPLAKEDMFSDICWPKGHRFEGEPIVLRDYQVEAIDAFLNNPQCVSILPTGSGKTIITAALSKLCEKYGRTIVIVPSKSLVMQTEADYINLGLDVGVYFGDRKEHGKTHTICTWQSLAIMEKSGRGMPWCNKPLTQFANGVVAIIVDEVHSSKAAELKRLLTESFAHCPIRWGLTGTMPPEESDTLAVISSIGPIAGKLSAKELQDKGVLSNCHVSIVQMMDHQEYPTYPEELTYLVTNQQRVEWIGELIKKIAETGNTLVLFNRIETGRVLGQLLPEAAFVSGGTKVKQRKEEYDNINEGTNQIVLATYGVAAVGISIDRIFNLVLIEPGKSFIRVIQSIGRGLRKSNDKDFVNVFDVCSTAKFSKKHLTARKKFYSDAQYKYSVKKYDWQT